MKKIIASISLLLLIFTTVVAASPVENQNSDKELYQDVIISSLSPVVSSSVDNYYKDIFKYPPKVDLIEMALKKIERPNGDRTEYYIINLEVTPYFGPHVSVGKDSITIALDPYNKPKVVTFEHLENYKLPDNYKDYSQAVKVK